MIKSKAFAKINLTLDIIQKLPNNYHEISSIMQLISLYDEITLEEAKEIKIECNYDIKETDNICYKLANLLKIKFNIEKGVKITIKKNIPIGSGMAGGSSNAAKVLEGLDNLWNLNLSSDEKLEIASNLGKDIPFFLTPGTALATGTGEILKELQTPNLHFLIANPGFEVSTKEAYESIDYSKINKELNSIKMIDIIKQNDILGISQNLGNDFAPSIFKKYPEIDEIRNKMIELGALNASMSGSGPTVFGIFNNEEKLNKAYNELKEKINFVSKVTSVRKGE